MGTFQELGQPILRVISQGGSGLHGMTGREVADHLKADGVEASDADVEQCLRDLRKDNFIEAHFAFGGKPLEAAQMIRLDTAGRQAVEGWPGPLSDSAKFDALIDVLTELAADDKLPQAERTKLQKAATALGGFSRDLSVQVIGNYLARV